MTPSLLLLALVAATPAPIALSAQEKAAAKQITAKEIRRHIEYLASDKLEGRGPGTEGDRLAQQYIVEQLKGLGYKPGAGDGSWLQPVELVGTNGHPERLVFRTPDKKEVALQYHADCIAASGTQQPKSQIQDGELVFVGYGIVAPEFQWDDYKGVDLKGKVLLMLNNDPEDDPALFAGKTRLWYGRWDYKYESAAKTGAAGAIIIHTTTSAGYPWRVVDNSWSGTQFNLPYTGGPQLQMKAWTTEEATRRLLAAAGKDLDTLRAAAQKRDFKPTPLGLKLSVAFDSEVKKTTSANVLGLLPGSDPVLSRQVVVLTAHHDHLGKKADAKPGEDGIYNGAVDNASGVAQLLAVARAFSSLKKAPKRTLLIASVAAEEQGLLGSQYLAEHPPVPPGAIAADINMDGANIWGRTRDVIIIGMGKSNLDELVTGLAKLQSRVVKADQFPDRGFFYRSDQFNFARLGVPSAYVESGIDFIGRPEGWGKEQREKWEATHYHQPSDEITPEWDLSGAAEDTQLYFYLGMQVANGQAMPQWTPGDEFELPRKKALEALGSARSLRGSAGGAFLAGSAAGSRPAAARRP